MDIPLAEFRVTALRTRPFSRATTISHYTLSTIHYRPFARVEFGMLHSHRAKLKMQPEQELLEDLPLALRGREIELVYVTDRD